MVRQYPGRERVAHGQPLTRRPLDADESTTRPCESGSSADLHNMRLLKRRKTTGFDPAMGDPDILEAIERLNDGDWSPMQELLDTRPDAWIVSQALHDDLTQVPMRRFTEWAEASGSASAMAHLGQAQLAAAWVVRGPGYASEVTDEARQGFLSGLEQAEATLHEAADMDPRLAEPWVGMMGTARGLELPKKELEGRFVQVHAREPFRPDACHHMLQSLCTKWLGSHQEMFEFAEWIHHEAPSDSPCAGIVPMAHLEYAVSGYEGVPLTEYLQRREVVEELLAAARPMLEATTAGAGTEYVPALNLFLLMIEPTDALSGRTVRETIARLEDRPSSIPWRHYGDDINGRFAMVRDERAKAAKRL